MKVYFEAVRLFICIKYEKNVFISVDCKKRADTTSNNEPPPRKKLKNSNLEGRG